MSQLEIELATPLRWPELHPRTPVNARKPALWKHQGAALTLSVARRRLRAQLEAITRGGQNWRTTGCVLTTALRVTRAGEFDGNDLRRPGIDPGVALYFELDKQPLVLPCDRWTTVQDNLAAIAAHIEALRGQERWGVADLAQAFAGHVALPAPEQWWQVLGLGTAASVFEIDVAWRKAMHTAHPDRGGSTEQAARLNRARDEGRAANG